MRNFALCAPVLLVLLASPHARSDDKGKLDSRRPEIPAIDDIEMILVECYQSPFGQPDTSQFSLPHDRYDGFLDTFRSGEQVQPDKHHNNSFELGTARIVTDTGMSLRICWYWRTPNRPLDYTVNGVRYKTTPKGVKDAAIAIDDELREILKKSRGGRAAAMERR